MIDYTKLSVRDLVHAAKESYKSHRSEVRSEGLAAINELARRAGERDQLRPVVRAFAAKMEERLQANDHKTGWLDMHQEDLLFMLDDELQELKDAANAIWGQAPCSSEVSKEAADVANFAMMLADTLGERIGHGRGSLSKAALDGEVTT